MTIADASKMLTQKLATIYDEREAAAIGQWVMDNITGLEKAERRTRGHHSLTLDQCDTLEKFTAGLLNHRPVQYVLNEAWFYRRKFFVDESVLIPRPETEELVSWVVDEFKIKNQSGHLKILDVGTGSGCIAISLAIELQNADVTAIDVSENALAVAMKNSEEYKAAVSFDKRDFLNKASRAAVGMFDVIVSNPPYIPVNEKSKMPDNVTKYEPSVALFVPKNDPFVFYNAIVEFSKSHLKEEGKIFVEVHESYAADVKSIFEQAGFIATIKRDIYGKERMVSGE